MNSLGIAVLIPGWYSFETTGGGKTIVESVKAFQKYGADTLILSPSNCKDYNIQKEEIRSHQFLGLFSTPKRSRVLFFPLVMLVRFFQISLFHLKGIRCFIDHHDLVMVLTHNDVISTAFSIFIKKLFSRNRKIVVVFPWYHVPSGFHGLLTLLALKFIRQVDILYTESSCNNLTEKTFSAIFEKKAFVAGVGIDYVRYQISSVNGTNKGYDACFVGRIHPCKGIFDLVKAWKIVTMHFPQSKLVIVGEGLPAHERELRGLITDIGLERNIDLIGFVPEEHKIAVISNSKVLVHPSYGECIPLVFLEAMACETPIVTYYLPTYVNVKDLIYSVKLGDMRSFANAILDLLNGKNEAKRESKLVNAKLFAYNSDWVSIAKRLLFESRLIVD